MTTSREEKQALLDRARAWCEEQGRARGADLPDEELCLFEENGWIWRDDEDGEWRVLAAAIASFAEEPSSLDVEREFTWLASHSTDKGQFGPTVLHMTTTSGEHLEYQVSQQFWLRVPGQS